MANYLQQTAAKPLFPKILWNRPINRGAAGSLVIIGGHSKEFGEAQAAYQYAVAAGAGECRVILPDSLKTLLQGFEDTWFVPSSPSGSIGRSALGEIDHLLESADGVLIGPNLSSNSETAIVTEKLVGEAAVPITVTASAIDTLTFHAKVMAESKRCLLVLDMAQLFKLANALGIPLKVNVERGILGRIEIVQQVAGRCQAPFICCGAELIVVSGGNISVTTSLELVPSGMVAAIGAAFWLQRQGDGFERLTTAAYICAAAVAGDEKNASVQAHVKRVEKIVGAY